MTFIFKVAWDGYNPNSGCSFSDYTFVEAESSEEAISIVKKLPIKKDFIIDFEAIEDSFKGYCYDRDYSVFTKDDNIPNISQVFFEEIMENMVECSAGSFIMGSPSDERGRSDYCEKQRKVIISKSFKIGKYPVTQKEYLAVTGYNPSNFKGENNPVDRVNWYDAKKFCEILNLQFKEKLPKGYKFDLPTEAQWEYACRAGTTTALNNGKNLISYLSIEFESSELDEVGWYFTNSNKSTHPVGQKKPNAWGIYDMHGNVWEWCNDWNEYDYPKRRVCRGGGSDSSPRFCRSASSTGGFPQNKWCGFRLALVSDDSQKQTTSIAQKRKKLMEQILENMIECPVGSFMMGSPDDELGRKNDEIQHLVTLTKSFKIGKYPVTQKEYLAIMGINPSSEKGDDKPVDSVGWHDARKCCEILNSQYKEYIPSGYKFTLPTEAQWEYACRAGTTTALNNGKNLSSEEYWKCSEFNEVGWNDYNIHPVGQKKPNAWGIYDMHGKVYEWCNDRYGEYPNYPVVDPKCGITGFRHGSRRVCRGGSRSANRSYERHNAYFGGPGFRLVLVQID